MNEFVVQDGNGVRREPVGEQMLIGRGWGSDLRLHSHSVSRRHAWVWRWGNQVVIEDLGSTHGTFVNGQLLRAHRLLRHNDVVAMGDARLTYVARRDMAPGSYWPPGRQALDDGDRTPPMGIRHLMASQRFCAQCGAANHPASSFCVQCGSPLPGTEHIGANRQGEPVQGQPVQRSTPTEPVVANPFPRAGSATTRRRTSEKGIWALAIIVAILTVVLLMTLGVLLVFTLG